MTNHDEDDHHQPFTGFERPTANYFRMPDGWIDISAEIKNIAELKVVEYILRHTWGYREYDIKKHITVDEFIRGRKRRDGSRMDKGTGLSEQSVRNGLDAAKRRGLVEEFVDDSDKARVKKYYGLRMRAAIAISAAGDQTPALAEPDQDLGTGVQSLGPGVQTLDRSGPTIRPRTETDTQGETFEKAEGSTIASSDQNQMDKEGEPPLGSEPIQPLLAENDPTPERVRDPRRASASLEITAIVGELSDQFHDAAHRGSNAAQAMNLYLMSGLELQAFVRRLYEAGSITRDQRNQRRVYATRPPVANEMAYYFVVLRDLLGLGHPPAPVVAETVFEPHR